MRNKILKTSFLAAIFSLAGNAYAVGQNGGAVAGTGVGAQTQEQVRVSNQGENTQIQAQNSQQSQGGAVDPNGAGTGSGMRVQQQMQQGQQDEDRTGNQIQNQTKNQGENKQIKVEEKKGQGTRGNATAEQRRSRVADAVQQMLRVADRDGGIGQQVRNIAQTQNQNQEKLETGLQKIESRGGFAKFFVGPNYGEINNMQKILEQNREQIKQLNQIKSQLSNQDDVQAFAEQIQILEQANLQIENSLQNAQKGFSLFGFMFKMFSK